MTDTKEKDAADKHEAPGGSPPIAVRMALEVALNHVEPGWENCVTIVKEWLRELRKGRVQ